MFGSGTSVPAFFVSEHLIRCISPSQTTALAARKVTIEVTLNGVDFSSNGLTFSFILPLSLSGELSPQTVPLRGIDEVNGGIVVLGSNFPFTSNTSSESTSLCRFGTGALSYLVPANSDSSKSLRCSYVPPAAEPGFVLLSVSVNSGVDWFDIPFPGLQYVPGFRTLSLSPSVLVPGSTIVFVDVEEDISNDFSEMKL